MANTIVSIFEQAGQAQQAQTYLLANGYSPKDINIKIASYKSDAPPMDIPIEQHSVFDEITDFFSNLFGAEDEEIAHYAEAGRRGTILTVHTDTSEQAEQVAEILDNFGASHANETSGSYPSEDIEAPVHHTFLDDPASQNPTSGDPLKDRAVRMKSRIVQRSLKNNSENSQVED